MAKKIKKNKRAAGYHGKKKHVQVRPAASARHGIMQQALFHHQAGRLAEAEALYRQILQAEPDHADALHYLGMLAHQVGRSDAAVELIGRSLAIRSDNPEANYNLGNALRAQGKPEKAAASYRRALALKPDYLEACYNLGILLYSFGKPDKAEASFRRVLNLKPDFAAAYNNLGLVLEAQGKTDEAVASYRKALDLKPDFSEVYNNLGNTLHALGKSSEAEAGYRQAVSLKPDYFEAYTNLGIELQAQGKLAEAESSYRQALDVNPNYVDAHNNLGMVYQDQGRLEDAMACYRRVLSLQPDFSEARSNLLLCLNYLPDLSISLYLDEARQYGRQVAAGVRTPFSEWKCSRDPERLRVGMVSGDFRNHSVGYFLENLLGNIDPARIELVAYPITRNEDELTARIRPGFAAWKSLTGIPDEAAAQLIHDDGMHVLLDLSGHTSPNRLPVFAWKPAPVQVSWLGYSASTGMAEMDFLLADPYIVPVGEENRFTETVWRLPEIYLCFSPPQTTVAVSPLPALEAGRITFGCFNNPTKMNDAVVALWARVLHGVTDSRLFLKSRRFSDPGVCESVRQRFAVFGVAAERILMQGFAPNREEHLAAYNQVDIALDPFPYNGTTTSVEGLWMGVPFITLRGDRFVARVGESIARNISLADWIAGDEAEYVAKAKSHAADLENLAQLRAGLRQQVLASPLYDGPRFARNFEEAVWGMWHRFESKAD